METQLIDHPRSQTAMKLLVGFFFAVLGILLTVDNLNLADTNRYLRFWPVVLVVAGLIKIVEPGAAIIGVILLVAGASLLAMRTGVLRFSIFDLWPIMLIVVGVIMVAGAVGFSPPKMDVPANFAIFSGQNVRETSSDYRGGRLTAMLGSYEIDLTEASITTSPAILVVSAMWGSIEATVPDDWDVVTEATPIMGAIDIKTSRSTPDPRKQLIIRGLVLMGSIEVRSDARRKR